MAKIRNRRITKAVNGCIGPLTIKAAYYMKQHADRLVSRGNDLLSVGGQGELGTYTGVKFKNG